MTSYLSKDMPGIGKERTRSLIVNQLAPTRFETAIWFEQTSVAAFVLIFLMPGLPAFDARMNGNERVLKKTFRCAVAFAILFETLGWVARRLLPPWRTSWVSSWSPPRSWDLFSSRWRITARWEPERSIRPWPIADGAFPCRKRSLDHEVKYCLKCNRSQPCARRAIGASNSEGLADSANQ